MSVLLISTRYNIFVFTVEALDLKAFIKNELIHFLNSSSPFLIVCPTVNFNQVHRIEGNFCLKSFYKNQGREQQYH